MTPALSIRVLLVGDSAFALVALRRLLSGFSEVEIVGAVRSGKEAVALVKALSPAVVCAYPALSGMNGAELAGAIKQACSRSVPIVSSFLWGEHEENVARTRELVGRIKVAARAAPLGNWASKVPAAANDDKEARRVVRLVAIGASVGGPPALNTVLRSLPADFPLPILCIQHIGPGFVHALVDWLGLDCKLTVKIAEPGELPQPRTAYFPQEGAHLILDGHGRLASSLAPLVSGHRPSVTVTFKSVASFYGSAAAGVLLTGMGQDGAEGMKAIADAGGLTIAQDEQTSVVFGMPAQAIALGAARFVLPIGRIAENLMNHVMQRQEHL